MDKPLKCDHSLKSCLAVLYCGAVCSPFDSQSETLCDKKFSYFDPIGQKESVTIHWKAVEQ